MTALALLALCASPAAAAENLSFDADDRFRLMFATAPAEHVAALPRPDENEPEAPFRGLFETPVSSARISSRFGLRLHPILGYVRMHEGIDYAVSWGSPVFAASDGVVEQAEWLGGYGRWVKLRHADGWETGYGHLSSWTVKPGDRVRQGQVIAYSGSTGQSTGPHLHYEVIRRGLKVDPAAAQAQLRPPVEPSVQPPPLVRLAERSIPAPAPAAPAGLVRTTWAWGLIAAPAVAEQAASPAARGHASRRRALRS